MIRFQNIQFLWPSLLWLLSLVPLVAIGYTTLLARHRRATAAQNLWLDIVGAPGAAPARLQRALPPLLWLLALCLLLLAVARPQATLPLPTRLETVILAVDMSGSMRATDIQPTRLVAAQAAARSFVEAQPAHVRIGVVAIAAAAAVVQSPTTQRADVLQAIDRLEPQRGTALGSGLVIALDAALPRAGIDVDGFTNGRAKSPGKAAGEEKSSVQQTTEPRSDTAIAIVLLSDGQSNVGPEPQKAAEVAIDHGVRVYTVGLGTAEGAIVKSEGWSMRTRLDEDVLRKVADQTGGEYFRAADAAELKRIYRNLGMKLGFERPRPVEITALVAALGAVFAALGGALSLAWFNRVL